MGPFPCTSRGNKFLIVARDYLTKWTEVRGVHDSSTLQVLTFINDHQHELAGARGTTCAWHTIRHVPSPARTEPLLPGATSTSRSGNPSRCHQANRIDIVKPPRKLQIQPALHRASVGSGTERPPPRSHPTTFCFSYSCSQSSARARRTAWNHMRLARHAARALPSPNRAVIARCHFNLPFR
ncbi:hypothetical protein MRX96_030150 [Rhipicephalus microplus]